MNCTCRYSLRPRPSPTAPIKTPNKVLVKQLECAAHSGPAVAPSFVAKAALQTLPSLAVFVFSGVMHVARKFVCAPVVMLLVKCASFLVLSTPIVEPMVKTDRLLSLVQLLNPISATTFPQRVFFSYFLVKRQQLGISFSFFWYMLEV